MTKMTAPTTATTSQETKLTSRPDGEVDSLMLLRPAVSHGFREAGSPSLHCRPCGNRLGIRRRHIIDADNDAFSHSIQQRHGTGDDSAGVVDALETRLNGFGVVLHGPNHFGACFKLAGHPGELCPDDVQVDRQLSNEQRNDDDGQHDEQRHDRTFPRTRARNR